MKEIFRIIGRRLFSTTTRRKIVRYTSWPPVGWVRFGSLRRQKPIGRDWGYSRGKPIDRYYIEKFLSSVTSDIKGHVLEVKDNNYTVQFGNGRITASDILHKEEGNPQATIVADLAIANSLPEHTFDCIICTQTFQLIYDVKTAIATLHHSLRPGGVLLVTLPTIAQLSRTGTEDWGDCWRFTRISARLLFEELFLPADITVQAYGNVLAATAFLHSLASEDLKQRELDYFDPNYELLVAVRAKKVEASL